MKRTILILAAIAFAFSSTLTSCKKDKDVTGVSLSQTTLSLEVGKSATLTATVSPSDADDKSVTWTSSNETVASVSNGTITAKAEGTATITVKTTDGGYTANCVVTIASTGPKITVKFGSVEWTAADIAAGEYTSSSDGNRFIEIMAGKTEWGYYPSLHIQTGIETGEQEGRYVGYFERAAVSTSNFTYGDWMIEEGTIVNTKYSGGKLSGTINATMFDFYDFIVNENEDYETRTLTVTFENIEIANATKAVKAFVNAMQKTKELKNRSLIVKK